MVQDSEMPCQHSTDAVADARGALLVSNIFSAKSGNWGDCIDLANYLEQKGWQVITTSYLANRMARPFDMLKTALAHRHAYNVAEIEVYSGQAFMWAEAMSWLMRRLKKPYLLVLYGGNLPRFAHRWPKRVRHLLQSAPRVITPSVYLKENLAVYREDISIMRSPVRLANYPFQPRTAVRPNLAWLRAFHQIYLPDVPVQAVEQLKDEFPQITLTMYGADREDGTRLRVEQFIRKHALSDNIIIPGKIPKQAVPERLSQHDIFLNSTSAESFGVSVVEAAALGMCIVTTNVGELPYIWTHEHDALLVPPNDPQAMADAVRRILTEPGLAGRLSRHARATAERFEWETILPQWENLLVSLTEEKTHG
jgi:glycosyltransferase involved in cell wall biosynthesis